MLTYSLYKHHNTFKALVGISPTGAVTFISDLYAGSVSDQALTRECGVLDHVMPGDTVMADKGLISRMMYWFVVQSLISPHL